MTWTSKQHIDYAIERLRLFKEGGADIEHVETAMLDTLEAIGGERHNLRTWTVCANCGSTKVKNAAIVWANEDIITRVPCSTYAKVADEDSIDHRAICAECGAIGTKHHQGGVLLIEEIVKGRFRLWGDNVTSFNSIEAAWRYGRGIK